MGMFDSFEPRRPIRCPVCDEEFEGWQSKVGPCVLAHFVERRKTYDQFGHRVRFRGDELPYRFRIYTFDDNNHWAEAEVITDKGVWVRTQLVEVRAEPMGQVVWSAST